MKSVNNRVPLYCRKIIADFLGVENSTIHNKLRDKEYIYYAYLLKKKDKKQD